MTHPFGHVCNLLSDLEGISSRDPPYLPARRRQLCKDLIRRWFSRHNVSLQDPLEELVALLSALAPAKRTDRVYNVQNQRLVSLLKRCLGLGLERAKILDRWRQPGYGDLGDCVERVLRQTDDPLVLAKHKITVIEVDRALTSIASRSRFSSSKIRQWENDAQLSIFLEIIYRSLHSRDAKWLTRMILKDFSCLDIDLSMLYTAVDPRFEAGMQMYDNFEAAVMELQKPMSSLTILQGSENPKECHLNPEALFKPRLGVKIGPPKWVKSRGGVQHLLSLVNRRKMSVEQKLDGEYCQVHVDLTREDECIQIFSKSGKDSTADRAGVHDAIKRGLRIGQKGCRFNERCILEGELVVWSEHENKILDFHKIRKHVSRSGSYLGTTKDSQQHPWERLMIVFYDVMLIDDKFILQQPYEYRRANLKTLVARIPGESDFTWRRTVDFSSPRSLEILNTILANAFARRWEGLVLKPVNEPYFARAHARNRNDSRWIKIKKDCIPGHGDTADLVALGGGYDPKAASRFRMPELSWTHIFIGCLKNQNDVKLKQSKPQLFVLDCLSDGIGPENLKMINQFGKFCETPISSVDSKEAFDLEFAWIDPAIPKMSTLFLKPFVLDIVGSGFDKPPNTDLFTLRFPRVLKVHWDRDWKDAVDFDELQAIAVEAITVPSQDINLDVANWKSKLDEVCRFRSAVALTDDEESGPDGIQPSSQSSTASQMPKNSAAVPIEIKEAQDSCQPSRTKTFGSQRIKSHIKVVIPLTPPSSSSTVPTSSAHAATSLHRRDAPRSIFKSKVSIPGSIRIAEDIKGSGKTSQLPQVTPKPDSSLGQPSAGSPLESPLQEIVNNSCPRLISKVPQTSSSKRDSRVMSRASIGTDEQAQRRRQQQQKGARIDKNDPTQLAVKPECASSSRKRTWSQSEIEQTVQGDPIALSNLAGPDRNAKKLRYLKSAHRESHTMSQSLNPKGFTLGSSDSPSDPRAPEPTREKALEVLRCVKIRAPIRTLHTPSEPELKEIPSLDDSILVLSQHLAEDPPLKLEYHLSQFSHPPIKLSSQGNSPAQPYPEPIIKLPNQARNFHFLQDTDAPRPDSAYALQQFIHYLYCLHHNELGPAVSWAYVWHWEVLGTALLISDKSKGVKDDQSTGSTSEAEGNVSDWLLARIEWKHAGRDKHHESEIRVLWSTGRQTVLAYRNMVKTGKVNRRK